jgi:hypothetical protein
MPKSNSEAIRKILQRPILDEEVQWRVDQTYTNGPPRARLLAYIDRTAALDRLDAAFGFDGWEKHDEHWEGGAKCVIRAYLGDRWVSKSGIGKPSNMEALKGASSDALKRACSCWGIGRNLYRLPTTFVDVVPQRPSGVPDCRIVRVSDRKKNVNGWGVAPSVRELQRDLLEIDWRVQHIPSSRDRRLARIREACKDAVAGGMNSKMIPEFIFAITSFVSDDDFVHGVEDPRRLSDNALKVASHRAVEAVEAEDWNNMMRWAQQMLAEHAPKKAEAGGES